MVCMGKCELHYGKRYEVPGGEIVLSKTEGIVISITGLLDGKPFTASWQAESISSILTREKVWVEVLPQLDK